MKYPSLCLAAAMLPWVFLGVASSPVSGQEPSANEPAPLPQETGIRLNFKGAPLTEVLNYLSEAAGFAIIQDADIDGVVTVISHQPLQPEEAVDLLNSILHEQGYAVIRNGRILKIVNRDIAHTLDLPVRTGNDPDLIPRKDEMVTQIIPVRYADATLLIENLTPLLGETAKLTANESSNALVMTDTLTNVRRIAEIIRALDTSISSVSTIRVFPLQFADATEVAEIVEQLFEGGSSSGGNPSRGDRGGRGAFFERFRMGDRGRGDDNGGDGENQVLHAASRVVAVADERSNALVVTAPDEVMPTIEQLVNEMDTNVTAETEVRIFTLLNADAVDLADVLMELFDETEEDTGGTSGFRGPFGRPPQPSSNGSASSQRQLEQGNVVAVGDPRTNSLLVTAARESMMQIAELVGRLDASSSRKERVYVYPLEHADVDNVAAILRGMFDETSSAAATSQAANPLTTRTTTGASDDLNTSFGGTRTSR